MADADEIIKPMDDEEAFDLAVGIIALNYRVSAMEVSELGILTTANVLHVLFCFVDAPGYLAAKTALAESESKKKRCRDPHWVRFVLWESGRLAGYTPTPADVEMLLDQRRRDECRKDDAIELLAAIANRPPVVIRK